MNKLYDDQGTLICQNHSLEEVKAFARHRWPGCFIDGDVDLGAKILYITNDDDIDLGTIEVDDQ